MERKQEHLQNGNVQTTRFRKIHAIDVKRGDRKRIKNINNYDIDN